MPRIIALLGLVCFFSSTSRAQERNEVTSYLEGIYENARSWQLYDCLIIDSLIDERPDGKIQIQERKTRIAFDAGQKKWLFIQLASTDLSSAADGKLEQWYRGSCIVSNGANLRHASIGDRSNSAEIEKFENLLAHYEFLDLRKLHFTTIDTLQYSPPSSEDCFERLRNTAIPQKGLAGSVIEGKDDVLLTIQGLVHPDDPQEVSMHSLVLPKKNSLPTKWRMSMHFPSLGNWEYSQETEWAQRSSLWVPLYVSAKVPCFGLDGSGAARIYEKSFVMNVHWFSVSEPLDKGLFDLAIADSPSEMRRLTDPSQTGATELMNPASRARKR